MAQPEPGGPAAHSLALKLFTLVALLSVLPLVLCGYLEGANGYAREQIWLDLRDRSAAVAHAFATDKMLVEFPTSLRSAQLAGFGAEAGGGTPRPALPTPAPAAPLTPVPSMATLEPPPSDVQRTLDAGGWPSASFLNASYWDTTEMRLAAFAYVMLVILAILAALSILRSLNRFRDSAYEIALGGVGDNALVARNGVRELSGVARLLDRLVFDLRYMSDQMRLTAEENAHSLRTPLATMRTALGAIRRSVPADEPRAQRALKIIDISLDRLSQVVSSAQRNDTTMADLVAAPRVPVDLTELTRDMIGEAGERAQSRSIRLRDRLQEGVIVHASSRAVEMVLLDVLASAVNASPRYAEIVITLEGDGAAARLIVEDRGCDGDTPELFFQHDFSPSPAQANSQAPDEASPVRLGLWNVKRVVEAFGGQVSAQRNHHNGVSVSVVLPSNRQ